MTEHDHQRTLIEWTAANRQAHPELRLLFAIPNGGQRSKAAAGKLKAEGVKAGVPDLFLPVARWGFSGLFLEMKAGEGKPTKNQKRWLADLFREGYAWAICWTWEQAAQTLVEYLTETGDRFRRREVAVG